jgi:hypothetical protein
MKILKMIKKVWELIIFLCGDTKSEFWRYEIMKMIKKVWELIIFLCGDKKEYSEFWRNEK